MSQQNQAKYLADMIEYARRAYHTSEAIRAALPSVAWTQIIGMRHRLVHDYGNINYDVVWDVVENDLPDLISALEQFTPPEPPSA